MTRRCNRVLLRKDQVRGEAELDARIRRVVERQVGIDERERQREVERDLQITALLRRAREDYGA